MKRSSERILTTHIGSLPRPKDLWTMIEAKDRGQPGVAEIVRKQVDAGIDIPSDGEQSKSSFTNYVKERLSGLEGINEEPFAGPPPAFPEYAAWQRRETDELRIDLSGRTERNDSGRSEVRFQLADLVRHVDQGTERDHDARRRTLR